MTTPTVGDTLTLNGGNVEWTVYHIDTDGTLTLKRRKPGRDNNEWSWNGGPAWVTRTADPRNVDRITGRTDRLHLGHGLPDIHLN